VSVTARLGAFAEGSIVQRRCEGEREGARAQGKAQGREG